MITVYHWASWVQGAGTYYDGICPDYPQVNGTGRTDADMRAFVVSAWNREFPADQKTIDDFDFVTAPPNP